MRAELLAVGTELLIGDIVNTNAAWLGERLTEAGIDVVASNVVGDDVEAVAGAIRGALTRADALVVTGGLGPTQDDLTREGLALAAGVELARDPDLESALRARFERLRRDVPEMNYRQADVPAGAVPLANPRGSAPGLRFELLGGVAYALPGVPHEMKEMFAESVLPDLRARAGAPAVTVHRVLRTAGMWESAVAAALDGLIDGVSVAFLAGGGQTRVRLTASAPTRAEALARIAPEEAKARAALGDNLYGTDDESLEGVVQARLRERGETLAVAESLTGGLLGATFSAPPGSSDVYAGGVVAYQTHVKVGMLGVPEGVPAVSEEAARTMAEGVRERLGATYGLSLTGVAGPAEQDGQPVGTVFAALAAPDGTLVRRVRLPGDRPLIRSYAVVLALDLLRRRLYA